MIDCSTVSPYPIEIIGEAGNEVNMIQRRVTITLDRQFTSGLDDCYKELAASPGMRAALGVITNLQLLWMAPTAISRQSALATQSDTSPNDVSVFFREGTEANAFLRTALGIASIVSCEVFPLHGAIEVKAKIRRDKQLILKLEVIFEANGNCFGHFSECPQPLEEIVAAL